MHTVFSQYQAHRFVKLSFAHVMIINRSLFCRFIFHAVCRLRKYLRAGEVSTAHVSEGGVESEVSSAGTVFSSSFAYQLFVVVFCIAAAAALRQQGIFITTLHHLGKV